jgi:hypothetical protein
MAAIVIGMNLWVPAIMFGTNIIIVALCLFINYKYFIVQIIFKPKKYDLEINWWKEVIPMQWKIALSCLSGYFAYSIMVPLTFAYQGAEIAGKLGMSLSIISGIIGIALSITIPKASQFGGLIADHQYHEANGVLRRLIINVLIITTVLSLGLTILYEILAYYNYKFIDRLLPIELFILLLISTIISSSVMPIGYYLRSYKKEPLLILSIVTGFLTGISIYISNRYLNIYYVIYSYVLLTVITSLCVPIKLYMHNYNIDKK